MLAITIVLFVVPHNQQIVTIRQFFTYRISLFRNQNLNIQEKRTIIFRTIHTISCIIRIKFSGVVYVNKETFKSFGDPI